MSHLGYERGVPFGTFEMVEDASIHPWLTRRRGSIHVLSFPPDHQLDDLQAAMSAIEHVVSRVDDDYGFIIDFARMTHSSAKGREIVRQTEQRINSMASVRKWCRGLGQVVRSPLQRRVLTAVNWFARRPYDCSSFMSVDEAESWLVARLAASAARRKR
jgi:hypothetical protein